MNNINAQKHFEYFKDKALSVKEYETAIGKSPAMFSGLCETPLKVELLSRSCLFDMAADQSVPIDALCISILAWGGVHKNNINNAFSYSDEWLSIPEEIRRGKLNRSQAYEAFYQLRQDKKLKGMGPAYYTKLIYFLMPRAENKPHGYIMDQWVACGVNLLAGRNVVLMDTHYWWKNPTERASIFTVSDANTSENYEDYCCFINGLSDEINRSSDKQYLPDEVEYCLMSKGGKSKQEWRKYVIEHRKVYG